MFLKIIALKKIERETRGEALFRKKNGGSSSTVWLKGFYRGCSLLPPKTERVQLFSVKLIITNH